MPFKSHLFIFVGLVIIVQTVFNPILLGNERLKLKRFPAVTITLVLLNVFISVFILQITDTQDEAVEVARYKTCSLVESEPGILQFEYVQRRLKDADLIKDGKVLAVKHAFVLPPADDRAAYALYGYFAGRLLGDFSTFIGSYEAAMKSHLFYRYGIAPKGKWRLPQLFTSMFLHGGYVHLIGNMIFLIALSISLETLWGGGVFLMFYIVVGMAACIPAIIDPFDAPMIGASGAISGLMGAFLISLHKTRLKIGWLALPVFWIFLILRRKPWGIARIPAFIVLPYYFASQLLLWWFFKEQGLVSVVAHSVHFGGFVFGMLFAVGLESLNLKMNFFSSKFSESSVGAETEDLLRRRQYRLAQHKLEVFLRSYPNDAKALAALLEVCRRTANYARINEIYSFRIRNKLLNGDNETALSYYNQLLAEFPENNIQPRINAEDWMTLCNYLYRKGLIADAAVEFERLADGTTRKPVAFRACVLGGEAALKKNDKSRALRLFTRALELNPPLAHLSRVKRGIDRCDANTNETCAQFPAEQRQTASVAEQFENGFSVPLESSGGVPS